MTDKISDQYKGPKGTNPIIPSWMEQTKAECTFGGCSLPEGSPWTSLLPLVRWQSYSERLRQRNTAQKKGTK